MEVDLRGWDVFVAEELLHRSDVDSIFEQVCREGVTERMRGGKRFRTGQWPREEPSVYPR